MKVEIEIPSDHFRAEGEIIGLLANELYILVTAVQDAASHALVLFAVPQGFVEAKKELDVNIPFAMAFELMQRLARLVKRGNDEGEE